MIDQELILGICWIQTCMTEWQAKDFIIRTEFTHKVLHSYSHMFIEPLSTRKKNELKSITVEKILELGKIRPLIHPEYFVQILESMVYYEYSKMIAPSENFSVPRESEDTDSMASSSPYPPSTPSSSSEPSPSIHWEDTSNSVPDSREDNGGYLIEDTRPSPSSSPTPSF